MYDRKYEINLTETPRQKRLTEKIRKEEVFQILNKSDENLEDSSVQAVSHEPLKDELLEKTTLSPSSDKKYNTLLKKYNDLEKKYVELKQISLKKQKLLNNQLNYYKKKLKQTKKEDPSLRGLEQILSKYQIDLLLKKKKKVI